MSIIQNMSTENLMLIALLLIMIGSAAIMFLYAISLAKREAQRAEADEWRAVMDDPSQPLALRVEAAEKFVRLT